MPRIRSALAFLAQWGKVKPIFALLPLAFGLVPVGTSWATEIDGKWGLGVNVGTLLSSRAETSILRGMSNRTAWVLDASVSQFKDDRHFTSTFFAPDTSITGHGKNESLNLSVGPRLRQFTRPESSFSPYWDIYAHFIDRSAHQVSQDGLASQSDLQAGGEVGFAIGAEYFSTRWPFSVGAHSNVASLTVSHVSTKFNGQQYYYPPLRVSSGTAISGIFGLSPSLQVRVYF